MNKCLFIIISVLCCTVCVAQVNLQTGAASINFPLFQYKDEKSRLNTEIGLSYISGNGLKVNQMASSVGTGWDLKVGGFISRIQNGEPDDQMGDNNSTDWIDRIAYSTQPDRNYPNGYLYTATSPSSSVPVQVQHVPQFPTGFYRGYRQNFDDREQDIFVFQFNGRIGKFVIGKDKVPKVLNDSRLAITFAETNMVPEYIRTRISSFTITDEEGIQYVFSEREISDVFKYNTTYVYNGLHVLRGNELGFNFDRKIITKWFLKEIVNPATNEKIQFAYIDYLVDIEGVKHMTSQTAQSGSDTKTTFETLHERTKMTTKRLSYITFPNPYRINFTYSTADRADCPGDKALTEMNVLYDNALLLGYRFDQGYFFKNQIVPYNYVFQAQDKRFARLCLNSFKKVGSDGVALPSHEFTYNIPEAGYRSFIPPMYSLHADHWGFYNKNATFISEGDDGYPATSHIVKEFNSYSGNEAKYGIIKMVKYPEGGTLNWEYEGNKAENSPYQDKFAGGVRVSKTISYDGISHDNDMVKDYKYIKSDGTSSAWGFETPVYTEAKGVRQYKLSGSYNMGDNLKDLASNFIYKIFYNAPQAIATTSVSGGMFGAASIGSAAFDVLAMGIVAQIFTSIFSSAYKDYTLSIIKNDNTNLINPLPFQYSRVEVIDAVYTNGVLAGTNGKTVYEFTSNTTFPLLHPGFSIPYSSGKQRAADWLYGLPRIITWENAAGQPVRKIENIYTPVTRQINADNNNLSRAWYVNSIVAGPWNINPAAFDPTFINSETYYPVQGRIELQKTIETVYNNNGASTFFETNYTYSDSNFLPRTVYKKDSKGDFVGTTTYYSADYNASLPIMSALRNANRMNEPISVNSWVKGAADPTRQLTSSTVTEFAHLSNSDIRPFQVFQSELDVPLNNSIAEPGDVNFSKSNFKDYSYLKPKQVVLFSNGNPVEQINSEGDARTAFLYGYNDRLVVAEVSNARYQEIKYTSFESDNTGGWTYLPWAVVADVSPTGQNCYNLAAGGLSVTPGAINKPVLITLWSTQTQVTVNAGSTQYQPARIGPGINGWTFLEFELPAVTGNISISGNGRVDEIRLLPKNARMTTYAYTPGFGKTTECDANNRITYFGYDAFGRLKTVKDQYRNLIKAYEYNYKQ